MQLILLLGVEHSHDDDNVYKINFLFRWQQTEILSAQTQHDADDEVEVSQFVVSPYVPC